MSRYIQNLINQGEHQRLDFKFEISDSRKIARSLVAFANTEGGKLLIGVKDNGAIAGVRSEEEFYMLDAAAEMYSRPSIAYKSREWNINGKMVLEITVPKPKREDLFYAQNVNGKWLVYVRVDDQDRLANKVLVKARQRKNRQKGVYINYTASEKLLLEYLETNQVISLSKFCRLAGISRYKAENILINFLALDIIHLDLLEEGAFYSLSKEFNKEY